MAEDSCIFCMIAQGKVQSKKIYEDEKVLAVLDINPANPGHVILLPKTHHSTMLTMPDDEVASLFIIAKSISSILLRAFSLEGTNIFVANGVAAGQKAPHFMVHIIPRYENDGLSLALPAKKIPGDEMDIVHLKILDVLKKKMGLSEGLVKKFGSVSMSKETGKALEPKDASEKPVQEKKQGPETQSKAPPKKNDLDMVAKLFG